MAATQMILRSCHKPFWLCLSLLLLPAIASAQQTPAPQPPPLTILTETLPRGAVTATYVFELKAQGGTEPRTWKLEEGTLPPGVGLSSSGILSGTPAAVGEFRFRISVTDSSPRPNTLARWFVLRVVAPLKIGWKQPPRLRGDEISGTVEVSNATDDDFDLTVIVVAVNEVGKAFALGYQHFKLKQQTENLAIEFGSTLPRGAYIVHADAVAEIEPKNLIHRSRLQTAEAIKVP
ncbi:MAG TPA: Ig domain-containing protein [Terriglobales bacterium]|nr:Ig domain-containing protein [Terriglobales bacterium]